MDPGDPCQSLFGQSQWSGGIRRRRSGQGPDPELFGAWKPFPGSKDKSSVGESQVIVLDVSTLIS